MQNPTNVSSSNHFTREQLDALANKTNMPIGFKCIICLTNSIYSLGNYTYAIPIASI